MIMKYSISKHKQLDCYVVWCETKTDNGYGCKGVFQGTRQECKEYLERLKESE